MSDIGSFGRGGGDMPGWSAYPGDLRPDASEFQGSTVVVPSAVPVRWDEIIKIENHGTPLPISSPVTVTRNIPRKACEDLLNQMTEEFEGSLSTLEIRVYAARLEESLQNALIEGRNVDRAKILQWAMARTLAAKTREIEAGVPLEIPDPSEFLDLFRWPQTIHFRIPSSWL